jgi:hypothetical protein
MGPYEELLRKLGLLHLKDDPDRLQEAILRELGLIELKDDPEALQKRSEELLKEKANKFESVKEELGRLIQDKTLKRNN